MGRTYKQGDCAYRFLYAIIICLACLITFHAKGLSQPGESFTLKANNIALAEVFKSIYKQTKLKVTYSNLMFNDKEKIDVNFSNTPIRDVMAFLLRGKGVNFEFTENLIILSKKEKKSSDALPVDTLINIIPYVRGTVTDSDGKPIPGATVMVKGTQQGTTTEVDGDFILSDVKRNSTLLVSSIGYETRNIPVVGKSILVKLNMVVSGLDETVVIAYGTTTRRLSTGNVSTVKAKEIERQPVSNPLLALQGRVPGLFINQNTGIPGGGITVRIQGQNSLSRGNDPLYVVDGVPYASQMLPNLNGTYGILGDNGNTNSIYAPSGGGNPLSFINPADIESVEVLKDADATSIYGSRAAAGAILITTKKGKAGKTKMDITLQKGLGMVTRMLDLMDSRQYLAMRYEAKNNDNAAIRSTDYDINGTWDTTRYTDWQKVLIGGTAHYTNAMASISGGTSNTQFLLNTGFRRETTVFPETFADKKGSLHLNVSHTSNDQKFRLQFSTNYLIGRNELINTDLTSTAIALAPIAPAIYKQDGTLNWAQLSDGTSTWYNPLAYLTGRYSLKVNNIITNAIFGYELIPGLTIKSSFGYTNMQTDEVSINPLGITAPDLRSFTPRYSNFSNGNMESYIIEPQLSYLQRILNGNIDVLIGAACQENKNNLQQFNAIGFNSDQVMEDIRAASSVSVMQSIQSKYRYNAIFGRINYNWENKYILNITARRDGSSRFGAKNLFHNFASVAGAWIISNEVFFKNKVHFLSFTKLRGSFGTTGNDQIGEYQFMNLYSPVSVPVAYQQTSSILPVGLHNPYLQWEETRKLQLGLEMGFFKDKALLNVTYYRNRSSNQLQSYDLPYLAGFASVQQNFPSTIQNTGWEASVSSDNFAKNDFSWSSSFNIAVPKNKLIAYPNLELSAYANIYVIGKSVINATKVFQFHKVDPETGLYTFIGKDGHSTNTPVFPNDQTILTTTAPTYYGGLENSFRYKGFQLDILFQFVRQKGNDYRLGNRPGSFISRNDGVVRANQPISILDRWQQVGDTKMYQKFSAHYPGEIGIAYTYAGLSSLVFSDASYIRLKNLSFSWQMPNRLKQKARLRDAKVFLQGQNLITWTEYIGLDPETRSLQNIPPLSVWTLGIQLSF